MDLHTTDAGVADRHASVDGHNRSHASPRWDVYQADVGAGVLHTDSPDTPGSGIRARRMDAAAS